MTPDNKQVAPKKHKRSILIGSVLLASSLLCIILTVIFIYVSSQANEQIESIREDYRKVADRRDAKVVRLAEQVGELQKKVDNIPDRTANKTADKVKQVVKEDESK